MGKCVTRDGVHGYVVRDLVFTLDGKGLLSASWDKMVIHISTQDSAGGLTEISRSKWVAYSSSHVLSCPVLQGFAYAVSVSPGNWIASGSWDKNVRIWNAHTADLQCILQCKGSVWSVDFSPSCVGNYLTVADGDGQVTIWNYTSL